MSNEWLYFWRREESARLIQGFYVVGILDFNVVSVDSPMFFLKSETFAVTWNQ